MILSRFPIVSHEYHRFSLGLWDDSEVKRGVLHAKIEVRPGYYVQAFTLHTQCTNFGLPPQMAEVSRTIRDLSLKELMNILSLKLKKPDC